MLILASCSSSGESVQPTETEKHPPTSIPTATVSTTDLPEMEDVIAEEVEEPDLDYTAIMLKPADLPPGFEELQTEFMGVSPVDISKGHFTLEAYSILWRTTPFELVLGFTRRLSRVEQTDFDMGVEHPNELLDGFLTGLGAQSVGERLSSTPPADIGNSASSFSVAAVLEGMGDVRVEVVVFRRASVGVYLFIMYLAEEQPVIGIAELAGKMDRRIIRAFSEAEP